MINHVTLALEQAAWALLCKTLYNLSMKTALLSFLKLLPYISHTLGQSKYKIF